MVPDSELERKAWLENTYSCDAHAPFLAVQIGNWWTKRPDDVFEDMYY